MLFTLTVSGFHAVIGVHSSDLEILVLLVNNDNEICCLNTEDVALSFCNVIILCVLNN